MRDTIRDAMARTMFVSAWADREEECGRSHPGQELAEVAPPGTPDAAVAAADRLVEDMERANGGLDLDTLFRLAVLADEKDKAARAGKPFVRAEAEALFGDGGLAAEFGSDLAMEALGTGVSWFDDHARFEMQVPYARFDEADLDDHFWSPEASAALDLVRGGRGGRLGLVSGDGSGAPPWTGETDEDDLVLEGMGYPDGIGDGRQMECFRKLLSDYALDAAFDEPRRSPRP